MTLRVCLNRLVFLLFSLARELSPFLLHEHVLTGKNPLISKLDCTWFLLGFPRLSKLGKIAIYPILVHHLDLTVTKSGKLENPDWEIKISKKSSFPHCTWIFCNPNLETQLYNPGLQGSQAWDFSFTGMDFNKPVLDCTINRLGVLSFQERILT